MLMICVALAATVVTVSQACWSGAGARVHPLLRVNWQGPGAGGARSERPLGFDMVQ